MNVCSFFGDAGDLFAAMSSFEAMGGDIDLCLYPAPGRCREPMTPEKVERLRPLLELQKYIGRVRYADQPEGRVLDDWRNQQWGGINLADMFARWAGVPFPDRTRPWLVVDRVERVAPVVVHRSPRYRERSTFPWGEVMRRWRGQMVMVGMPEEHRAFEREVGKIPFFPTEDYLSLSRVIAGCDLFIGNQSSPYNLAVGLQRPTWLEQHRNRKNNCHWQRPNAWYDQRRPPRDIVKA